MMLRLPPYIQEARAMLMAAGYNATPVGMVVAQARGRAFRYAVVCKHYARPDGREFVTPSFATGAQDALVQLPDGQVAACDMNKPDKMARFLRDIAHVPPQQAQAFTELLPRKPWGLAEIADCAERALALLLEHHAERVSVEPWHESAQREASDEARLPLEVAGVGGKPGTARWLGAAVVSLHTKKTIEEDLPPLEERIILAVTEEPLVVRHPEITIARGSLWPDGKKGETPAVVTLADWRAMVMDAYAKAGPCAEVVAAVNRYNAALLIARILDDPAAAGVRWISPEAIGAGGTAFSDYVQAPPDAHYGKLVPGLATRPEWLQETGAALAL